MDKVAVLMSGGIDSSVTAYLLLSKGYKVIGVTLNLYKNLSQCWNEKNVLDARYVASKLDIPHYILDLGYEFEKKVIDYFCKKYVEGLTPNPCIICNTEIKFGLAFEKIKEMFKVNYISTGHYARITCRDNKYFITAAVDQHKDQSYFLSRVLQERLKFIKFPLGELTKNEVKKIAQKIDLNLADKPESFEICFIRDGDYRKFLIEKGYNINKKGKIIQVNTGKFLGYHKGYANYTIGQRGGLRIENSQTKLYVTRIEPESNTVYVGTEESIYSTTLIAKNCVVYDKKIFDDENKFYYAKIRYKSPAGKCRIRKLSSNQVEIEFTEPQRAITPGQFVVVYNDNYQIVISGEILSSS